MNYVRSVRLQASLSVSTLQNLSALGSPLLREIRPVRYSAERRRPTVSLICFSTTCDRRLTPPPTNLLEMKAAELRLEIRSTSSFVGKPPPRFHGVNRESGLGSRSSSHDPRIVPRDRSVVGNFEYCSFAVRPSGVCQYGRPAQLRITQLLQVSAEQHCPLTNTHPDNNRQVIWGLLRHSIFRQMGLREADSPTRRLPRRIAYPTVKGSTLHIPFREPVPPPESSATICSVTLSRTTSCCPIGGGEFALSQLARCPR